MKKQTAEDVENIPIWPINVLALLIPVERNNVYSVRNQENKELVSTGNSNCSTIKLILIINLWLEELF